MNVKKIFINIITMIIFLSIVIYGAETGGKMLNPNHKLDYVQKPVLDRDYRSKYKMEDFIGTQAENIAKNWAMTCESQNPSMMAAFDKRNDKPYQEILPWSGEFPGKFLRGLTQLYRMTGDPQLKTYISGFVGRLVSKQADNGYIGVWDTPFELTDVGHPSVCGTVTWDIWNHYHIMHGLLLWYEETGDQRALNCAVKIGDLFCEKFLNDSDKLANIPERYTAWSIGHSLAYLYKITGDKKYFDLSEKLVDNMYQAKFPDGNSLDYLNRALNGEAWYQNNAPGGVRWEGVHSVLVIPEMYFLTGKADYAKATENMFWGISAYDVHNHGGFTSMEQANGNPYDVRSVETCCTISWEALGIETLRVTGNSVCADELEVSLYNAVLGFLSRDGKWTSYNTPMDGKVVPSSPDLWWNSKNNGIDCCTVNAPRGIAMLTDWAVMSSEDGIALNWYGKSKMTGYYKDIPVNFNIEGNYPVSGDVKITMDLKQTNFELALRIPNWSDKTTVIVNGQAVNNVKSGEYLKIKRDWKTGDVIKVSFDMSLKYWRGGKESAGKVSIYRGPVLMTLERQNVSDYAKFDKSWEEGMRGRHLPYFSNRRSNKAGAKISYEFEGDYVAWLYNRFENAGIAKVIIDGKEVDKVDLYAKDVNDGDLFGYNSDRPDLFLSTKWEKKGLGKGRHTLEIVVTGEKNAESKDAFVNVREFLNSESDPILDMTKLDYSLTSGDKDSATLGVAINLKDINGNTVRLVDYDSAAETHKFFATWIRATNSLETPFTRNNPFRLSRKGGPSIGASTNPKDFSENGGVSNDPEDTIIFDTED